LKKQPLKQTIRAKRAIWRTDKRSTLRRQYHFAITAESLSTLQHNSNITTTDNYTVQFYDTKDALLLRNNWWLLYQRHRWELRVCKGCEFDTVTFEEFTKFEDIIEKLYVLHRITICDEEELRLKFPEKFAEFVVTRLNFNCTDFALYLDSAKFADEDYYLVGTLSSTDDGNTREDEPTSRIEGLEEISPVRSKVCEYLFYYRTDLYKILVDAKFIPEVPFTSLRDTNHHSYAQLPKPDWKRLREAAQQKYVEANKAAIDDMRRRNEAHFATPEGQLLASYLEYQ